MAEEYYLYLFYIFFIIHLCYLGYLSKNLNLMKDLIEDKLGFILAAALLFALPEEEVHVLEALVIPNPIL